MKQWYGEPRRFNYLSEVQPVLDKHCIKCHDFGGKGAKKIVLAGDKNFGFNISYCELQSRGLTGAIGAGPVGHLPALTWGSRTSPLIKMLAKGHNMVNLCAEDMDRLATWIDLNAPYYPTGYSARPGPPPGRNPLTPKETNRLFALTGLNNNLLHKADLYPGPQVSFDRPEISPCLKRIKDASKRAEALAIIRSGKTSLRKLPRADMPGFSALHKADQKRLEHYKKYRRIEQEGGGHGQVLPPHGRSRKGSAEGHHTSLPGLRSQKGYELAGFVWFQGWNDFCDLHTYPNARKPGGYDMYSELLAHFVRDVRKDLSAPKLPFVIGVMGVGGPMERSFEPASKERHRLFRAAMAAPAALSEFKGTVVAVQTAPYYDQALSVIDRKLAKVNQMAYFLRSKHKKHANKDGTMTCGEQKAWLKEYRAKLLTPEEEALWKRGASGGGCVHYLGCARTYALASAKALPIMLAVESM